MTAFLTDIKRAAPEEVLKELLSDSRGRSTEAGLNLVAEARTYGLSISDYLKLAVDPLQSPNSDRYMDKNGAPVNGFEAALMYLNLPVRNQFDEGITLQAAADTFQKFPGTRALFPEVVDNMVKWKYRQTNYEMVESMLSNSRTISGTEMISTVVDDTQSDYQGSVAVAEGSRIPVKSIRTTQYAVTMYKHGLGYRVTYEFARRAALDILTPYANRAMREMEISKVAAATSMLINGDGVHSAAPEVDQSSYNSAFTGTATAGLLSYKHLLRWLVDRAKAGVPIDTVVGNYDAYVQWLGMFAIPTTDKNRTDAENLEAAGFMLGGVPVFRGPVNFVLSSTAPANKLIGFSRGDTLEELVEAGSLISESEQSVSNQTVTYYRTMTTGYRLVFGDTRSVFDFGN